MQLRFRVAGDADVPLIRQLDGLAGDSGRSSVIEEAVESRRCLVAESGDAIVGYVVTAPRHFFERDFVELLIVDDDYRRCGVGRALLGAAVDRAETSRVFSSTNESNGAMRALFDAEGWTHSGRLDGLDPGDPELVYFIDQQT